MRRANEPELNAETVEIAELGDAFLLSQTKPLKRGTDSLQRKKRPPSRTSSSRVEEKKLPRARRPHVAAPRKDDRRARTTLSAEIDSNRRRPFASTLWKGACNSVQRQLATARLGAGKQLLSNRSVLLGAVVHRAAEGQPPNRDFPAPTSRSKTRADDDVRGGTELSRTHVSRKVAVNSGCSFDFQATTLLHMHCAVRREK